MTIHERAELLAGIPRNWNDPLEVADIERHLRAAAAEALREAAQAWEAEDDEPVVLSEWLRARAEEVERGE